MPTFVLEVGTEELPADFVDSAIEQWQKHLPKSLKKAFLTPESIQVYGTPRRLALAVKGLPDKQPDREEEIKGPPAKVAFKEGKPTKAAEGFAKKQGVELDSLEVRPTKKGEFVFIQKQIPGKSTTTILPELIPAWINSLEGKRFMRWGNGDLRFPRPIRWLVTLLDGEVLPIELVDNETTLKSDRLSPGHRVLHPEPVKIPHAETYLESLKSAFIEVNQIQRKNSIKQGINKAAQTISGQATIDSNLLAEVTNLVEYPTAVVGSFEPEFLELPDEVITTVMVTHQRYFPIQDIDHNLLPNFITISNGDPAKSEIIAAGNGRVIRARLADAQFFYKADLTKPLEDYVSQLETMTFQEKLGTVKEKVERFQNITGVITTQLKLSPTEKEDIQRTAFLAKADLMTQMVYEFPELEGIMGEKYALASGEKEVVAKGISDHYLPRGVEDNLPQSLTGQVVGIADRLDSLVSIFGLGMIPTGSTDPFALRRAANAIINIIWSSNLTIDLAALLREFADKFVATFTEYESPLEYLKEFFLQRIQTLLQGELNIDYDLVNAVLGENDPEYTNRALEDLLDVRDRALFIQEIRNNKTLDVIYETVNRSTRLAVKGDLDTQQLQPGKVVNPELFEKASEQGFYDALVQLVPKTKASQEQRNYQLLVDELAKIAPTVSTFFDGEDSVLVMAEDKKVKENRLNLLGLLRNHARVLADFGPIVKQG